MLRGSPVPPEYVLEKVALLVVRHAPDVEFVPLSRMPQSKTPMDSPYAEPIRIKSGSAILAELGKLSR